MKKNFVVYPFLFAVFPVLALYSHNIGELFLRSLIIPLSASLGLAVLLFALTWFIFRSPAKAGVVTLVFLIVFFSDGHAKEFLIAKGWARRGYLPIVWIMFFSVIIYMVWRTKSDLKNLTKILNIAGIVLIVPSLVNILIGEFQRIEYYYQTHKVDSDKRLAAETLPDIYYIILDAYSGSPALKELQGFDNSEFIDSLKAKGFYVANNSTSNYSTTVVSLPSSLNMEYLNYLADELGENSRDITIPTQMYKNNAVAKFLRQKGYRYIHMVGRNSSGMCSTNGYADENIYCYKEFCLLAFIAQNDLITFLIDTTILNRLKALKINLKYSYKEHLLTTFVKLAKVPQLKGPKFIFAHIMCPHPPYILGTDDEEIKLVPMEPFELQRPKYLKQLKALNTEVEILIDEILSKSKTPPIIILQGDHGSRLFCKDTETIECLKSSFSILNAYYFPNGGDKLLYDSISPVNTFRVIFNSYFGSDYELLIDQCFQSYFLKDGPYKFIDVTDCVRHH